MSSMMSVGPAVKACLERHKGGHTDGFSCIREGKGGMTFDWHSDEISRETPVTADYRTTQNVRRFLAAELVQPIKLKREDMAWIRSGAAKTMGDVADGLRNRLADRQS